MNVVESLTFGVALALLVNMPIYIRNRRMLRLAKARLELSQAVTAMDQLMLTGKVTIGDACHDNFYQMMLRVQYAEKTYYPWRFWIPPSKKNRDYFRQLHQEMSEKNEVAKAIAQFVYSHGRVLCNSQPFMSKVFALYVLVFCGGLKMLLIGVKSAFRIHSGYKKFRQLIAEWSLVLEREPGPQFRTREVA